MSSIISKAAFSAVGSLGRAPTNLEAETDGGGEELECSIPACSMMVQSEIGGVGGAEIGEIGRACACFGEIIPSFNTGHFISLGSVSVLQLKGDD